ncbi:hypothetical protein HDK77DRAFT_72365 [Phyllosticta capitalensis]
MRLLRKNLAGCKRNCCTGPESSCARPYRRYARRRILTTVPRPALYNHTFGESIRARMLQCRGWRLEQHKNQSNRHVPRSSPTMLSSRRQVHRPAKSQQQQQAELMQPHLPGTPASTCAHFGYSMSCTPRDAPLLGTPTSTSGSCLSVAPEAHPGTIWLFFLWTVRLRLTAQRNDALLLSLNKINSPTVRAMLRCDTSRLLFFLLA